MRRYLISALVCASSAFVYAEKFDDCNVESIKINGDSKSASLSCVTNMKGVWNSSDYAFPNDDGGSYSPEEQKCDCGKAGKLTALYQKSSSLQSQIEKVSGWCSIDYDVKKVNVNKIDRQTSFFYMAMRDFTSLRGVEIDNDKNLLSAELFRGFPFMNPRGLAFEDGVKAEEPDNVAPLDSIVDMDSSVGSSGKDFVYSGPVFSCKAMCKGMKGAANRTSKLINYMTRLKNSCQNVTDQKSYQKYLKIESKGRMPR